MTRPAAGAKTGSMRQIQNMPSTPGRCIASTCGFSAGKGQCARGLRNLPHTSVQRFRKCGVKTRSADQTPVLRFRDLQFCCRKSGCARRFPIFPTLPENTAPHRELKRKSQHPRQHPVVAKTSKGRYRKTEQRPFFVSASRRVRDDCITENILP